MNISGMAAYGVLMSQGLQQQQTNVAMVKANIEASTQAAQVLSEQASEQAKVAAASSTHKLDILA